MIAQLAKTVEKASDSGLVGGIHDSYNISSKP